MKNLKNCYKKGQKNYKSFLDKYSVFVADFETTFHKEFNTEQILNENKSTIGDVTPLVDFSPNSGSQVFLAGLMSLKNYDYKLSYENLPDFFNNITNFCYAEKHRRCLVYFHNLAYDGSYILNWLLDNKYKQTLKVTKFGTPDVHMKEFSCLISGGKFFNIVIRWRGITITFVDSLKLFPQPLSKLGETIGYPKLKELVDYTKFAINDKHEYPNDWLVYLKRDCEILAHYLVEFFKNEPKSGVKRQTIGAISYAYIKPIINKTVDKFTINDYNFFQNWYHGGLCFPSLKHWAKWVVMSNKVKMIDATSMYPSQMIKPLPVTIPSKEFDCLDGDYCAFYVIKVNSAIIKKKYNDIACIWKPFKYNDKGIKIVEVLEHNYLHQYLQSVEEHIYYVCDIELEMWEKLYDIDYEILESYYSKVEPILEEKVKEMFIAKKNADANHDLVNKTLAKLRLNNLYGKLGQKPIRNQDYYGELNEIDEEQYEVVGLKNSIKKYVAYNIQKKKDLSATAAPIFIASYITALARVSLLSMYKYIVDRGGVFLYCDTDSVCFVDCDIQFKNLGKELGQWGVEIDNGSGFCALCPKQYRVVNEFGTVIKLASAGVKKDVMKSIDNCDYNYDLGDNEKYNIYKVALANGYYGKEIVESPFNFLKWKQFYNNPIYKKEWFKNEQEK